MGNQPRNNFNAGGFYGFQHGQQYNQQQGQWRNHPGNQFNGEFNRKVHWIVKYLKLKRMNPSIEHMELMLA